MSRFQARATVVVPRLVAAAKPAKAAGASDHRVDAARDTGARGRPRGGDRARARVERDRANGGAAGVESPRRARPRASRRARQGDSAARRRGRPAVHRRRPRTDADYRQIVERWIVPDYNGAARPRAILDTPRGARSKSSSIRAMRRSASSISSASSSRATSSARSSAASCRTSSRSSGRFARMCRLRDEVSRLGLLRGKLSWASAGLDTGRPGYTLGNTPQPHNEGNFTALGPRRRRHGRRRSARAWGTRSRARG